MSSFPPKSTLLGLVALSISTLTAASSALPEKSYSGQVAGANISAELLSQQLAVQAQSMLSLLGTARVELSGVRGNLHASADLLVPIKDSGKNLTFTQLGLRYNNLYTGDYRTTANIGLGHRYFLENKMVGANVFYDHDITNNHSRVGVGAEYGMENLQFNLNAFKGVSAWRDVERMEGYQAKSADGFDVKLKTFLPSHPQLGLMLGYEKFFGDEVALFNKYNRSKNPHAWSYGINYTPFQGVTLGLEQRRGQYGKDTRLILQFNISLDQKKASAKSSFDGEFSKISRFNLVERSNDIVLKYKKNLEKTAVASNYTIVADAILDVKADYLPDSLGGVAETRAVKFTLTNQDGTPASNVDVVIDFLDYSMSKLSTPLLDVTLSAIPVRTSSTGEVTFDMTFTGKQFTVLYVRLSAGGSSATEPLSISWH